MRVLHYNILDGFDSSATSAARFVAYLREHPVDVLLLNEYRPGRGLSEMLAEQGFAHHIVNLHHRSANRAALFSRHPFEQALPTPENLRFAGALIGGVHLVSYHASPHGVHKVKAEVERMLDMLAGTKRILLCGDLNSLARRDERALGYAGLTGGAGLERYSEDTSVSFAVLDLFERAGFTDNRGTGAQHTVPTALGRAHEKGAALRLDYALSRNVAVTNVEVLRAAPFDLLSDHFPLLLELRR